MAQSTLTKIKSSAVSKLDQAKSKRADIQGLRAIAVVAVVLDHLVHWPSGGFVGVDVFFVISGFLITGILLKEHDRTGTISFSGFYRRRIKRIMPAAVVALAVTATSSYLLFNASRAQQIFGDAIWSLFFSANWHFATIGTDYFQAAGPVSPLQHFWSLAVEEQFYFVWPWLMLLIFWLGSRSISWDGSKARTVVGGTMLAIVVLSFAWAMFESTSQPTIAYFSTFTRAWELGISALLAVFAGAFKNIPALLRPVLGWIGVAGIFWSIFTITSDMPFPAPWAAIPVLATALVIASGTGGEQRFMWPLTNKGVGYVGQISYSLYLWHFPVIILTASVIHPDSPMYVGVAVGLMALLSVGMYYLVERPILRSDWLDNSRAAESRKRSRRESRTVPLRLQIIGISLLAVVTAGVSIYVLLPASAAKVTSKPAAATATQTSAPTPTTALQTQQQAVLAGLSASNWPTFQPSIDNLSNLRAPQWTENNCLDVTEKNVDLCVYGAPKATKTAVVMGDSVATSWLPGIIKMLAPLGYSIHSLTYESCPNAHLDVYPNAQIKKPYVECRNHQAWAENVVRQLNPDLIIMSNSALSIDRLVSKKTWTDAANEWAPAYSAALSTLPATSKTVTLAPAPGAVNLESCYTPISHPSDCIGDISQNWKTLRDGEMAATKASKSAYIDTEQWFCAGGHCPAATGNMAVFTDSSHLTRAYSESLAPVLTEAFKSQGLLG